MIEKLREESAAFSLTDHQKKVTTAIELATKDAAPQAQAGAAAPQSAKQTGVDSGLLIPEVMLNMVVGSKFSAALAIRDDLASSKKNTNSILLGGGPEGSFFLGTAKAKSVSLVPDGKKKRAVTTPLQTVRSSSQALIEKANITSMSVTGSSTTGSRFVPIAGLVVAPSSAPNVTELKTELALVQRTMQNPYAKGKERLIKDLAEGVDRAEEHVARNPQAAPKMMKS